MPKKKIETKKQEIQPAEISWRAAEYHFVEKGPVWYAVVIAVGLLLIVTAFVQHNFFFALFLFIATAVVLYFGGRRPHVIDFTISDSGVSIGKKIFYGYDKFENFGVRERPGQLNELILKRRIVVNPYLRLPIDSSLTPKVKLFLAGKLPEAVYEPKLIDIFSEWLGF